jgi:hypothetical protein
MNLTYLKIEKPQQPKDGPREIFTRGVVHKRNRTPTENCGRLYKIEYLVVCSF